MDAANTAAQSNERSIAMSSHSTLRLRALALGAASLPLAFGAAACSSDAVADKVAEKIAESAAEGDVDVDFDSDSGEFSVRSEDGSSTFSIGSSELPDGWPEEVPLPDDFEISSSLATDNEGGTGFNLTGKVKGDVGEAFAEITERFVDDGWTEQHKSTGTFGDSTSSSASYDNGTWQVMIGATQGDGEQALTYTVVTSQG